MVAELKVKELHGNFGFVLCSAVYSVWWIFPGALCEAVEQHGCARVRLEQRQYLRSCFTRQSDFGSSCVAFISKIHALKRIYLHTKYLFMSKVISLITRSVSKQNYTIIAAWKSVQSLMCVHSYARRQQHTRIIIIDIQALQRTSQQ